MNVFTFRSRVDSTLLQPMISVHRYDNTHRLNKVIFVTMSQFSGTRLDSGKPPRHSTVHRKVRNLTETIFRRGGGGGDDDDDDDDRRVAKNKTCREEKFFPQKGFVRWSML